MNEISQDRIRKRAEINPALVHRPDIQGLAESFVDVLLGNQRYRRIGQWIVNNSYGGPNMVTVVRGDWDAALAFMVMDKGDVIEFDNYHREAFKGWGVSAFSELEHAAANLAKQVQKPVTFIFPVSRQPDTEKFLSMRGYKKFGRAGMSVIESPAMKRTFPPTR